MLWHPANPDAVTACVARARENARGVREQISSEMWEHLNRLHLLVSRTRPAAVLASPHEFFVRIREGSHAFQGVMKATLPRGEAYEFLELGTHLERADATARLLAVKVPGLIGAEPAAVTHERLSSLLSRAARSRRSASRRATSCAPARVVAYLLLERRLPRAVCFCLELSPGLDPRDLRRRAAARDGDRPRLQRARVHRAARARRSTELLLGRVMRGLVDAADEIAAGYFTTRVIPPGPYAQQLQQHMILRVEHTTEFAYDAPDRRGLHRAAPAAARGRRPALLLVPAATEPPGLRVREYRDHFGNDVQHFDVLESHDRLAVTAVSEVMTPAPSRAPSRPRRSSCTTTWPDDYAPVHRERARVRRAARASDAAGASARGS